MESNINKIPLQAVSSNGVEAQEDHYKHSQTDYQETFLTQLQESSQSELIATSMKKLSIPLHQSFTPRKII